VYLPTGVLTSVLQWSYPQELEKCRNQADVEIYDKPSPGPAHDERELKIVTTMLIGLHYVLRRPEDSTDLLFMDPGDGLNFKTFEEMNNTRMKSYGDTGISIIVKKKT
jgi:hypothetical protein